MKNNSEPASLSGKLLISHPGLHHDAFRRTVVWLCQHDSTGASGIIVNRIVPGKTLGDLAPGFANTPLHTLPVHEAGPVGKGRLAFGCWHSTSDENFHIHFGVSKEDAREMLITLGMPVRAFFGWAEWSPGQLDNELRQNAWVVSEVDGRLLCEKSGVALWRAFLLRKDPGLGLLAEAPDNPSSN
ncbi:MAG: YqgE/AlgH family protein [Puniceicoccales bacterium]|jgi:putative transcriptional regulator|nr:YqgE/AlgH family protein [Puniceicoccales bacterium]